MGGCANPKTYLLLAAFSLTIVSSAISRTIYVDDDGPADFNNIQAAVDDSNDGDTIIVAEGTYKNVFIDGKSITLKSTNPTNPEVVAATIIDGGGRDPAVCFNGSGVDDPIWTLSGFTITNGYESEGGGISCFASLPMIINNIITNNTADTDGGGICCVGCPGGMIINNIITRNFADDGNGGGILLRYNSSLTVANCTITKNIGYYGDGGILLMYSSSLELTNSIVWGNNSGQIVCYLDSDAEVRYSNIEGGYAGIGNIDTDPCFADAPNDDYHLLPDSPCIDAGDPNYVAEPNETDLDGRPRVINGRIDMGAYEYSPLIPADVRIVPRTINLASKGKWVTCYIWLGEGYDVADIDSSSFLLEDELGPQWVWFDEEEQVAMVMFSQQEVQSMLDIGDVELTITGQLIDGTIFEAKDVIIVINKGGRKSAKQEKTK